MGTLWREYGVIAVLLTVSVGGYLYLSESEEDLLGKALQSVSNHLLALVPEGQDQGEALAALSIMEDRVARGEVRPEQMERLAASILNLRSSRTTLEPEEAEMLVMMALEDPDVLPSPSDPAPAAAPTPASRADMTAAAGRVESMFELWQDVDRRRNESEMPQTAPPIRFYADEGLRVVVDERLRSELEGTALVMDDGTRMLAWQARLAESVEAESERIAEESAMMAGFLRSRLDSLDQETSRRMDKVAMLNRLRSHGVVLPARAESLAVREGREMVRRFGGSAAVGGAASATSRGTTATREQAAVVRPSN